MAENNVQISEDLQLRDKAMFMDVYELKSVFDSPHNMMPSCLDEIFKCLYNFQYYS